MVTSFLDRLVQRSNRNMLTVGVVLATIVIGVAVLERTYLYNFFLGPKPLTNQQLLDISDLNTQTRYYVTVGGRIIDTGYQLVSTDSTTSNETIEASYGALVLGDKLLLIKTADAAFAKSYTGALVDTPSDIQTEVIAKLEQEQPDLKDSFLPFMLDTSDFRGVGIVGLIIGGLVLLFCLRNILLALARSSNPASHPIMRGLQHYGPLNEVKTQIDAEAATPFQTVGGSLLTEHWLLKTKGGVPNAMRLDDIAWLYKKVTQHRVNFVPTGKTFEALFYDRYGALMTLSGKQDVVDQAMQTVAVRVPWAIIGYNKDLQKAWRTNRQAMIAAVDAKRPLR